MVLAYADEDYKESLKELYDIEEEVIGRGAPWFKHRDPAVAHTALPTLFSVLSAIADRVSSVQKVPFYILSYSSIKIPV